MDMIKSKISNIFIFLVIAMVALSCAKEGPNGATGPAGPTFTGIIQGHVTLYDQYGSPVIGALKKVQLTLLGSSTVLIPAINPDTNGLYAYSPVSTGNYAIMAFDTGYGYTLLNDIQFVSNVINVDVKLSQIPVFSSTSFTSVKALASANDSLVISFAPDTRPRNCIIFVYDAFSYADTTTTTNYILSYKKGIAASDTAETLLVPAQDLYNVGFVPGSTVYYSEFSYVVNDASVYEDTVTGKKVYYAISNPKIDSAIVP